MLNLYFLFSGTRETAFIYSILSAGVTDSVTRACSAGNLTDCTCDPTNDGKNSVEGWVWGGCSDNIDYGLKFSRKFVDAPEVLQHQDSQSIRNKMNVHNNEVGRRVIFLINVYAGLITQPGWKSYLMFTQ